MAWTNLKGFNFRSTLSYVTDGTNEKCVNLNDTDNDVGPAHPTSVTIDGDTFNYGYTTASGGGQDGERDRSAGANRRLAGIHFATNGSTGNQRVVRFDVPAGTYEVHLALGDATASTSNQYAEIIDNTTVRATISDASVASNSFVDATGTERTAANWVSSEAEVSVSITSGILAVKYGHPSTSGGITAMAHIAFKLSTATISSPTPSGALGTATTATIGCTTDTASGTLYRVVSLTNNVSGATAAQIAAGNHSGGSAADFSGNSAISTTTPSASQTGLSAGTLYYYALCQDGTSNVVSGSFTTASATVGPPTLQAQIIRSVGI